jgi:hypothetical protein
MPAVALQRAGAERVCALADVAPAVVELLIGQRGRISG